MARGNNQSLSSVRSEIGSNFVKPTTTRGMENFLSTQGSFNDARDLRESWAESNYEAKANDIGGISYKGWLSNQVDRVIRNKKQEAHEAKVFSTPEGKAIKDKFEKAYKEYSEKEAKAADAREKLYIKIKEVTNKNGTPYEAFRDFVRGEKNMEEGDAKVAKAFPKEYAELQETAKISEEAKKKSDEASKAYQDLRRIK